MVDTDPGREGEHPKTRRVEHERIRVQGDNVQTWLNGEEMVNIRDEKIGAGQGRIALQIHDGGGIKVLWRNLHLQTL